MQIHELNNFNGTPGATNFLAIDDGSDTSRISGEALLDPVNSRIDNLTANVLPDSVETILDWADVESASKTLTKNVSGFDYLDLYFKEVTSGTNRIVFAQRYPRTAFPAQVTIPVISWGGGTDPKYLYFQDLMIAISGTTLTMSQLRIYSWDGKAADGANIETGILVDQIRVDGVKISSNTSAELTDLRTAHNGTVYASARAAREADYNALDVEINIPIKIQGYEETSQELIGGVFYPNKMIDINGFVTVNNWTVQEVDVNPNTKYLITGTGTPLLVVHDSNGNTIDYVRSAAYETFTDYVYVTPTNAAKILINSGANKLTKVKGFVHKFEMAEEPGGIIIEGYSPKKATVEGIIHKDALWDANSLVTFSGWNCLEANIEPYRKYYITGTGNPAFKVYSEDGILLDSYMPGAFVNITDYEYIAHPNAYKIYVNRRTSDPIIKYTDRINYKIDANSIAAKEGDYYNIGNDKFVNKIKLHGSANGLFNFDQILHNGTLFKYANDDITPINLGGVSYVGANHGYNFGYELTISAHGLTYADIGKTYNDGTNIWILIKIISENKIQVVCYNSSVWYKMQAATVPATVNFGTVLTVSASTRVQIYPSVKNSNVKIIKDKDGEFCVLETYDIIDIGVGLEALIGNVGSNDNDSLVSLSDGLATIRNIYEFLDNGATTIYQNLKMLKNGVALNFYGGIQSIAFTASDYFAVAESSFVFQPVGSTTIDFARSTWYDPSKPPMLYMQADGSGGNKAMFIGFLGGDRNADIASNGYAGFIQGSSKKMYPYLINPSRAPGAGKVYNSVSFRMPCVLNEFSNNVAYGSYVKVYDDYYLLISTSAATNTQVMLPEKLWNKKCEVFMSDGVSCGTERVIDSVDVISSGRGYLILKLTEN